MKYAISLHLRSKRHMGHHMRDFYSSCGTMSLIACGGSTAGSASHHQETILNRIYMKCGVFNGIVCVEHIPGDASLSVFSCPIHALTDPVAAFLPHSDR